MIQTASLEVQVKHQHRNKVEHLHEAHVNGTTQIVLNLLAFINSGNRLLETANPDQRTLEVTVQRHLWSVQQGRGNPTQGLAKVRVLRRARAPMS